MNNYIIFNKKYIQKLKYHKLLSDNLNYAILECIDKKFNIIYAIEEGDIFVYFGAIIQGLSYLSFTTIDMKKNFTLFIDVDKVNKYISKVYENCNFDNLFLFKSKLFNLNESYRDLYNKFFRNMIKKNNLIMYVSKLSDFHINFTNYIFDIIYITNDDFNELLLFISNIELSVSKFMIFNMNYLIFYKNENDIIDALEMEEKDKILLSNNNNKYKNFMITEFKNIKTINTLSKKYFENINIIKIYN